MEKYGPLVQIANKLQDAFSTLGYSTLSLPQIAVVGGQSAGKSSVLETVVGADFLPRGKGICTRRPLVLQLTHVKGLKTPYGVFLTKPKIKFTNFGDIRTEIERQTDALTGKNKGISDVPINLKIYSSTVTNLTLIDLPGITRVPTGDQPKDVEQIIESMVLRYIKDPNCIILAVHPAPSDLANSQALATAFKVDPERKRTLGVLTKLDLMGAGQDVVPILAGEGQVPLKLGYIAVVNRTQKDIDEYKKIEEQWADENRFFKTHAKYGRFAKKCGTNYLTKTLSKLLATHIRRQLPEIETKVREFMREKQQELAGMDTLSTPEQKMSFVLQTANQFSNAFTKIIDGRTDEVSASALEGGALIAKIFTDTFVRAITADDLDILKGTDPKDIETTIRNCMGIRAGLFVPDSSFEVIIKRAIKRLRKPALACVHDVHEVLIGIVEKLMNPNMKRFGSLADRIHGLTKNLIHRHVTKTQDLVNTLVDMELARVSTDHPDFTENRSTVQMVIANQTDVAQQRMLKTKRHSAVVNARQLQKELQSAAATKSSDEDSSMDNTSRSKKIVKQGTLERESKSGFLGTSTQFDSWYGVLKPDRTLHLFKNRTEFESGDQSRKLYSLDRTVSLLPDGQNRFKMKGVTATNKDIKDYTFRVGSTTECNKWFQMLSAATAGGRQWEAITQTPRAGRGRHRPSVRPLPPPLPSTRKPQIVRTAPPPPELQISDSEMGDPQTLVIRRLLSGYFNIVRKKIRDSVPKAITLMLITQVREGLQTLLVQELYSISAVKGLLGESEEAALERERVQEALKHMESAMKAIEDVRRFT